MRKNRSILFCALFACLISLLCTGCFTKKTPNDSTDTPTGGAYDLGKCRIECSPSSFDYDGTEHKARFRVYSADNEFLDNFDPEKTHAHLTATYADNVNAGTATVTVSPKSGSKKYTGTTTGTFTVYPISATVSDKDTLIAYLADGNHKTVSLGKNLELNDSLSVPQGVTLSLGNYTLVCRGDVSVRGNLRAKEPGTLRIEGDLSVSGTLSFAGALFVSGAVRNDGKIQSANNDRSTLYANTAVTGDGVYDNATAYSRRNVADCEILLDTSDTDYTGKAVCPAVTVLIDKTPVATAEYNVSYTDNIQPGEASVTVESAYFSTALFGAVTLPFTVTRAAVTVHSNVSLHNALSDPHYDRVHIAADFSSVYSFEIPQGYTVTVDDGDRNCIINSVTANGNLVIGDTTVCLDGDLTVATKLTNNGSLFISSCPAETVRTENNGTLYINGNATQAFAMTGNTATVRTPLPADKVHADKTESDYTGNAISVSVTVAAQNEPAPNISYTYVASNKKVTSPVDAGDITVTVTANRFSTRYYGATELPYRICRISATVTNTAQLLEKCAPNESTGIISNYDRITADCDCVLPAQAELRGQCEIVVPEGRSMSYTDSLTVYSKTRLTVKGSFAQCGSLYVYGEIVNEGTAYLNGSAPENVTGGGTVYIRNHIRDAQAVDFVQSVTYNGTETALRPAVLLTHGGTALQESSDFTVRYENADAVTDGTPAQAVVTAAPFSQRVYGTKSLSYTIAAGTCSVGTYEELIEKTTDVRHGTTVCNWGRITVTQDLRVACDSSGSHPTVTVCPNTVLRLGEYTLGGTGTYNIHFKLINNGTVELSGSGGLLASAKYYGTGECIGYADSTAALWNLSQKCDKIILTADVIESGKEVTFPSSQTPNGDLTVDLNGHTLSVAYVNFNVNYGSITVRNGKITADKQIKVYNTGDGRTLTFSSVDLSDSKHLFQFTTERDKQNTLGVSFD